MQMGRCRQDHATPSFAASQGSWEASAVGGLPALSTPVSWSSRGHPSPCFPQEPPPNSALRVPQEGDEAEARFVDVPLGGNGGANFTAPPSPMLPQTMLSGALPVPLFA